MKSESCLSSTSGRLTMLPLPVACLALLCCCGVCAAQDDKGPEIPSWAEHVAEAGKLGIPVAFENDFGAK